MDAYKSSGFLLLQSDERKGKGLGKEGGLAWKLVCCIGLED